MNGALGFAVCGFPADGFSFIGVSFPFADSKFDLQHPFMEIEGKGDKGIALLFRGCFEAQDFFFMEEESAGAERVMIKDAAMFIRGDMHAMEEEFSVFLVCEAAGQGNRAGTYDLDFGSSQLNSRLDAVEDRIIPEGGSMNSNLPGPVFLRAGHGDELPLGGILFRCFISSRSKINFSNQLSLGDLAEGEFQFIFIRGERFHKRAHAGDKLADALGHHIHEHGHTGDTGFSLIE